MGEVCVSILGLETWVP